MKRFYPIALIFSILGWSGGSLTGQSSHVRVDPPEGSIWLTRPYRARTVPEVRLTNSGRLESLMRAGKLYLRAEDAVALAIENNVDVEVQRYGPLLAREVLRRAEGGGALRSVGLPVAAGPQSVSLQGVSTGGTGQALSAGGGVGSGGGIVTQLGPVIPSFDPTFSAFANFQHATIPQSNTVLTGTTAFEQDTRTYQLQYSQTWAFGLNAQVSYFSQWTKVNSQFFALNPYTNGNVDLQLTQNLLQGFGKAVNQRNILVQRNNLKVSDLQFKQQLITTVSAVLNLYWDLVAFHEDVRAREQGLTTARQLLQDNKRQVEIGSLAEIEVTRAEAQLYGSQQELVVAQTNLLQQETILKNALVRNGVAAAGLTNVGIIPLDHITVPAQDVNLPLEQMVEQAIENRVEIAQNRINLESNQINLVGIKNSLKPGLQAFAQLTNNGLTGDLTAVGAGNPNIYALVGGYVNLLDQLWRRHYPNYSAGVSLNIPLRNRAAQSDYVTSQLEIRQNELNLRKNMNQVRVDVQNAIIGLQQARSRHESARRSRVLQQQTLEADQKKYALGASTAFQVVQDQRDLATAQSAEVQAMANYTHAMIALDQALGRTLEVNKVSVAEAMEGAVSRQASLPAEVPAGGER